MSSPVDAAQAWVYEYQARFGAAPGAQEVGAELRRCVEVCKELLQERERLRAQLGEVETERDQYLQALYALTHREFDIDKEAVLGPFEQQQPLAEFIAAVEAEVQGE